MALPPAYLLNREDSGMPFPVRTFLGEKLKQRLPSTLDTSWHGSTFDLNPMAPHA
jgi:hypothetical protein|tara:strand:- start:51 stop:215 length:165 start_codon:yes stop_codon:yes gene_type:complete